MGVTKQYEMGNYLGVSCDTSQTDSCFVSRPNYLNYGFMLQYCILMKCFVSLLLFLDL